MNYIETGLPHTDLFRRKSDFEPPRYKPLCNLGRKYLGLEPLSKSELESVTNRLCQPKRVRHPEDTLAYKKGYHPIGYGSHRFSGRRRMTGDQIENMVARLSKTKADTVIDNGNIDKVKSKSVHFSDDITEKEEEINSDDVFENITEKDKSNHNQPDPTKVLERIHPIEDKITHSESNKLSMNTSHSGTIVRSNEKHKNKVKEGEVDEGRYESLYYRGVKTEIARKFLDKNYKRLSLQSLHGEKSGVVKTPKTEIYSMKTSSDEVDFSFRPMRVKST